MKKFLSLFVLIICLNSTAARATEFEDQVRKIYSDLSALMNRNEIDIPAVIEFSKKYYADDVSLTVSILDAITKNTDVSTINKAQMIDRIHGNYAQAYGNHTEINISSLSFDRGPWHALVRYEMKYEARLKLVDKIGRHFERPVHRYYKCEDELQRSARGYPQVTESDCKGAVLYGDIKYTAWHE